MPELRRTGYRGPRLARGLAAAGLLVIGLAFPAHGVVTIDGSCNIVVSGISGSAQVTIYAPNCSASALRPSQTFSKQDAQRCSCTSTGHFVRQLEAQIDRLCKGLCERPGYTQSYRMLSQIAQQLPACCHPEVMDQVLKADVSCKVKILARLWTKEDDLSEGDLIAQASKRFESTPAPEECYRN